MPCEARRKIAAEQGTPGADQNLCGDKQRIPVHDVRDDFGIAFGRHVRDAQKKQDEDDRHGPEQARDEDIDESTHEHAANRDLPHAASFNGFTRDSAPQTRIKR